MACAKNILINDVKILLSKFKGHYRKQLISLFFLGISTGFRIREILSLKIGDVLTIDGDVKTFLTVKTKNMKGKKRPRTVRLPEIVRKVLGDYIKNFLGPRLSTRRSDFLFPSSSSRNKPMSYMQVYRAIKSAAERAGMNPVGISTHSMRKTWVVNFLKTTDSANPYDTLQVAGGWTSRDSMMHYIPRDDEVSIVNKTQERLSEAYCDLLEIDGAMEEV